ncbi:MAG: DUF2378 family protein [Myxococcales bacterium]|nr:DUF2378 family protein [Myxococcales bacterium]MDP3502410.1 DUF2378 family protein [Myxococcales bacterium]
MAEPRVAFSSLMQSLEKILRPIDAPTMERVRALGIDFDKLLPAYPVETWYAGVELAMSRFDPSLTPEQKQNHFGVRLVEVYGDTLVGKAMYAMMRIIGPERSIQRATRSFRTATNFLDTSYVVHGPRDWELTMNEVVFPHRYPGFFEKALSVAGAKNVKVELTGLTNTHATYRSRWD